MLKQNNRRKARVKAGNSEWSIGAINRDHTRGKCSWKKKLGRLFIYIDSLHYKSTTAFNQSLFYWLSASGVNPVLKQDTGLRTAMTRLPRITNYCENFAIPNWPTQTFSNRRCPMESLSEVSNFRYFCSEIKLLEKSITFLPPGTISFIPRPC